MAVILGQLVRLHVGQRMRETDPILCIGSSIARLLSSTPEVSTLDFILCCTGPLQYW